MVINAKWPDDSLRPGGFEQNFSPSGCFESKKAVEEIGSFWIQPCHL